ncbi:MAG: FAD-dependent oxidoreductase [Nitrosopumilus sp.]
MKNTEQKSKKAIIIGCGIAGPSLAIALKRAGIDSAIYEEHDTRYNFGLLSLTPNTFHVLDILGVSDAVLEKGYQVDGVNFYSSNGNSMGRMGSTSEMQERYGSGTVMIRRMLLNKILCDKAESLGVKIEWGKKLKNIEVIEKQKVLAHFEDGTKIEGDMLVGCDGIHSKTRTLMMPDFPELTYTGTVLVGGIIDDSMQVSLTPNTYHMTFGRNLHFGNLVEESGDKIWWTYVPYPEDSVKNRTKIPWDKWEKKILTLLQDDHEIVRKSVEMTRETLLYLPIYNIPHLPTWHKGLVCLIGDAAHAISPHAGQGATMAIEDTVVLAKCLRDKLDIQDAFVLFEKIRKRRAEKVVKVAQQLGNIFSMTNPVQKWFRNKVTLPLFIKRGLKPADWIYSYKIDWDEKIK